MDDEPPPRHLKERTGKHYCVKCMAEVAAEEYLRNDHVCESCAAEESYPLQTTPEPQKDEG